jgi:putative NADPH-quinone reductase
MHCLVVKAHPLSESLCSFLTQRAVTTLQAAGHQVVLEDLYAERFDAALTPVERAEHYENPYPVDAVAAQAGRLVAAEAIVLVFPTWWFGFPAILKGWFDRVWCPGVAYEHAEDLGPLKPKLGNLRHTLAVTSLGAPWWVDRLVMRQPVKRVLKTGIVGVCAPQCRFEMLAIHKSEKLSKEQVERFAGRVEQALSAWPV